MKQFKLFFILLLASIRLYGQDPYYSTIDISKGLPSNFVYNIFQDSKGFMWFATNDGICRYDGFEFKSYYDPQQTSRAGTLIKEDKYGRIWYENFDGYLYYIENNKLHKLESNTPIGCYEYAILNEILVFVQKEGVGIIRLSDLHLEKTIKLNLSNLTNSMQVGKKLFLFVGGIKTVDEKGTLTDFLLSGKKADAYQDYPNIAAIVKDKAYFIHTDSKERSCYLLQDNNIKEKFKVNGDQFIQNLCYAGNKLWFCTTKGVICYDTSGALLSSSDGWIKNMNVNCIYRSKDNCYWIGTAGKGLLLLRDLETKVFVPAISISKLEYKNKQLLIGTKSDEIMEFDPVNNGTTLISENKDNHPIDLLKYDKTNDLIYYTSLRFNQLTYQNKQKKTVAMAAKDMEFLDGSYNAIAATGLVGLMKTSTYKQGSIFDSLYLKSNPDERGICKVLEGIRGKSIAKFDGQNAFYCATNLGLYRIDVKGATEIKSENKSVYFSKIEPKNNKLIALGTNGLLWTIDTKNNFTLIDSSGLIKNIFLIDSILCAYKGTSIDFFIIEKSGLLRLNKSYPLSSEQVYDIKMLDDQLYIATNAGLLKINFESLNKQNEIPDFYINYVGNKDTLHYTFIGKKFGSNQNDIEVSYSLLDYKNLERQKIFYSINKEEWKELPANSRTLRLASLSGGEYQINFKLNDEILKDAFISFTIATPWWKQWWFIILSFILVCLLIVFYFRWQANELRKKNELLIQKIELEKNLNQSMLTSIKAQMNPHFFYNALNTIQSYIFTDDKKNATTYLSKFSKLTRIILEMSEKETVSLNEEINALSLYLELEKVRFNQDFDFSININDNVNTELIKIPSMIIQPFIENAIKHGLLHKKGEKRLVIEFILVESKLKVIIEDNGIGRKKSDQLNKIKENKHNSFSTSANTKRLEILNEGKTNKVGIEIIDKYDSNGQPEGTRVIIQIPI